jgi:hypothetical protein
MMTATIKLVLIARHSVVERHFARQSAFCQQFQCAINGGKADLRVLLPHQPEKLIGGKMVARIQERAQNSVSLLSMLQSHTLQMLEEYFLGLAYGFSRWRRMIVNSLLQHL